MNTLRLRALEPEDLELLYQIENDTSLWAVGVTNVPYSRYTLHDYIARSSDDIYVDRQVRLMIETANGETIGLADITNFSPQHLRAEVGIVIMQQHRRRGYGRQSVLQLCDYALNILHLHQLYAVVAADNEAALSLFGECGFQGHQVLSDWLAEGHGYKNAVLMQRFL